MSNNGDFEVGDSVVCNECGNRYDLVRGPLEVEDVEIWHSDGEPALKIAVDIDGFVWCDHCAQGDIYPDDSMANNTDYDFPNRWPVMTDEEKSEFMTRWRTWEQAKRQDTTYGNKMQELLSDNEYRVD